MDDGQMWDTYGMTGLFSVHVLTICEIMGLNTNQN